MDAVPLPPAKVHLVQCLCPQRHCIVALAFQPGDAAKGAVGEDVTLTVDNAGPYLLSVVKQMVAVHAIDPFCGICKAPIEQFHCEVGVTRFLTMKEAEPALRAGQEAQLQSAALLKTSRN